jgi:hypothetical protein
VRQSLFTFEDCSGGDPDYKVSTTSSSTSGNGGGGSSGGGGKGSGGEGAWKAKAAARRLKAIYPGVQSKGHVMSIPMPGHAVAKAEEASVRATIALLTRLIDEHDAIFLYVYSECSCDVFVFSFVLFLRYCECSYIHLYSLSSARANITIDM